MVQRSYQERPLLGIKVQILTSNLGWYRRGLPIASRVVEFCRTNQSNRGGPRGGGLNANVLAVATFLRHEPCFEGVILAFCCVLLQTKALLLLINSFSG